MIQPCFTQFIPYIKENRDDWEYVCQAFDLGGLFKNKKSGMNVLYSLDKNEETGKTLIHISCSHKNRLPSWEELKKVKDDFIGKEKQACQILPKESEYVNFHPYCLHLWANLE